MHVGQLKTSMLVFFASVATACAAPTGASTNSSAVAFDASVTRALGEGHPIALQLSGVKASPDVQGVRVFVTSDRSATASNLNSVNSVYVGSVSLYPAAQAGSFSLEATEAVKQILNTDNAQSLWVTVVPEHASAGQSVSVAQATLKAIGP